MKEEKKPFLSTNGFIYNYMITINTMDKMGKVSMTYNKINFLTIHRYNKFKYLLKCAAIVKIIYIIMYNIKIHYVHTR